MALRVVATIWSSGRRSGNCGSNSRQNSQGRLERVSKRLTTAGSLCSTEGGSWERRGRIRRFVGQRQNILPSTDSLTAGTTHLYYKGRDLYKPFVVAANFLFFRASRITQVYRKRGNAGSNVLRRLRRGALISGMIWERFILETA